MAILFDQLFRLADEIVRESVLVKLSIKDLTRLDVALNNHEARAHSRRWLRNVARDCKSAAQLTSGYLDWMHERRMKIGVLYLSLNRFLKAIRYIAHRTIEVETANIWLTGNSSQFQFASSLRGLRNVLVTAFGYRDKTAWATKLFENNPNLQSFVLKGSASSRNIIPLFAAAVANCNNMKEIHVPCCGSLRDDMICTIAQRFHCLAELILFCCSYVTDQSLCALAEHCSGLRILALGASQGSCSMSAIAKLLCGCRLLQDLRIWDCSSSNTLPCSIVQPSVGEKLTRLELTHCTSDVISGAKNALLQLRHLSSLSLRQCTAFSASLLIAIVRNIRLLLQHVTLTQSSTVTDAVVAALGESCPLLEIAILSYCPSVTDITSLGSCPQLRYLAIAGCAAITQAELERLAATPGRLFDVYAWETLLSPIHESPRIRLKDLSRTGTY